MKGVQSLWPQMWAPGSRWSRAKSFLRMAGRLHPLNGVFLGVIVVATTAGQSCGQQRKLGWLSSQYEVGRGGPETVSTGKLAGGVEDPGGKSYGSYQLASKRGIDGSSVLAFVKQYYPQDFREPDTSTPGEFKSLQPGTALFDRKWRELVKNQGDLFRNNEHEFVYETHYEPVARSVKELTGLDVEARGNALRNVVWSVAVQNGPPSDPRATGVRLIQEAVKKWGRKELAARPGQDGKGGVSDEELINAIYNERGKKKADGKMFYFPKADLSKRFRNERAEALAARRQEQLNEAPDLNKTKMGQFAKNLGIIAGPVRRKPKELFVDRGQRTFDFSGYDRPFETTRKPAVPNARSGVRIGRGYNLGRLTKQQIEKDLRAAGFSESQIKIFAGAAGLRGDKAREYLNSFNYSRLSGDAHKLGLQAATLSKYVSDNSPATITLEQQKKLFELSYAQAEQGVRSLFPGYDKFPAPAQEAVADMFFDLGAEGLSAIPGFARAVSQQDWQMAALLSKRNGAGVAHNQAVRQMLQSTVVNGSQSK
jgi:hypothetical protein